MTKPWILAASVLVFAAAHASAQPAPLSSDRLDQIIGGAAATPPILVIGPISPEPPVRPIFPLPPSPPCCRPIPVMPVPLHP